MFRHGAPFHHAPRQVEVVVAVNRKAEILAAQNLGAGFLALGEFKALFRHGAVPLPHHVADRAGYPLANGHDGRFSRKSSNSTFFQKKHIIVSLAQ